MTRSQQDISAALDWLVRLQRPSVSEADWLAFDAWLAASPVHAQAYDAALAFDHDLALALAVRGAGPASAQALSTTASAAGRRGSPQPRSGRRVWVWSAGAALAAAFVAGLVLLPPRDGPAPETVYSTGVGQRRTVALEDGSRIDLNAGSRIAVRFERGQRHVTLGDAQAFFDIAKDPQRPFVIEAGDTQVRVVGTRFDVRRRDGAVAIAVQRGVVEVRTPATGEARPIRLAPGQGLSHVEGQVGARVGAVAVDEITGWRDGRLIYRDQPLSEIVTDLNRQFPRPVKLGDAQAGELRLSGVLIVDKQDAMLGRLAKLLPIKMTATPDAIVILSR